MRNDIFHRLPPPTALLLIATVLDRTRAHDIPRPTSTVPHRTLEVVSWPLQATTPPLLVPDELRRRALAICGFIGGDQNLPATCQPGSHCVLDPQHNAVGCCPNGAPACTTGVFTGCVDYNSGPQSVVDPYVFTCQGSNVCYKNTFAGGYSQFGCGTASNLATSVALSASGAATALLISSSSVPFTAPISTLATPTSIDPSTGTRSLIGSTQSASTTSSATSSTSRSSSSTSNSSSSTSSKSSSTSPTSTTSTPVTGNAEAPAGQGSGNDKTGAIIGGAISGAAVLIALLALAFYLWKRKQRNVRRGPGAGGTEYISPMTGFKPLHTNPEGYETGLAPGVTTQITAGPPGHHQTTATYHYPGHNPAAYASVAAGGAAGGAAAAGNHRGVAYNQGGVDADQVPLTREFDDFSRGFQDALERIGEEDHNSAELAEGSMAGAARSGNGGGNGGPHRPGVELTDGQAAQVSGDASPRPLWQQNRRQSRNLMWM